MASMFSIAAIKNQLDEVRASVYPKNETERKVYEALSSKNWGASSTLMNDIAQETYDYEKYNIIMNIIWQNIEGDGRTWKQVFKALTLIDFLVKNGSERVIEAVRDKMFKIRTLQDYNYYENSVDKGSGVREKSKQIVELLGSNEAIRAEREKARQVKSKFVGIGSDNGFGGGGGYGGSGSNYGGSGSNYGGSNSSYGGSNSSYGGSSNYGGSSSGFGRDTSSGFGRETYGNSSGGRYDDNSKLTHSNSNNSFGGGAYDSSRPPRFEDDQHGFEDSIDEEDKFKSSYKPKTSVTSSSSAAEKPKLKVNIKKSNTPAAPVKPAAQEVDLFNVSDVPVAPAPVAAPQVDLFDPFASPAPVAPAPPAPAAYQSFDPFASQPAPVAPQQPAFQAAFDPFQSAPAPAVYQAPPPAPAPPAAYNNNAFMGMQPAYAQQPQQQPAFNAFQAAPAPAPMMQQPANNFYQQQPAPMQPQQSNMYQAAPAVKSIASHDTADFGDFETASSSSASKVPDKWGDMSKLVDLSSIGKNEEPKKQTSNPTNMYNYGPNSFAGLDGFSKAPQSMGGGMGNNMQRTAPMPPPMNTRPQQPQQPMGMPMNMSGGMGVQGGYGQQPMNMNMGGMGMNNMQPMQQPNMYGMPQQQPPQGGMYPNMMQGGYGAPPAYPPQQGGYRY